VWENGGWTAHLCGQAPNDFSIDLGRGYFVRTAHTVTWTYSTAYAN
jgi:hypothetical protein